MAGPAPHVLLALGTGELLAADSDLAAQIDVRLAARLASSLVIGEGAEHALAVLGAQAHMAVVRHAELVVALFFFAGPPAGAPDAWLTLAARCAAVSLCGTWPAELEAAAASAARAQTAQAAHFTIHDEIAAPAQAPLLPGLGDALAQARPRWQADWPERWLAGFAATQAAACVLWDATRETLLHSWSRSADDDRAAVEKETMCRAVRQQAAVWLGAGASQLRRGSLAAVQSRGELLLLGGVGASGLALVLAALMPPGEAPAPAGVAALAPASVPAPVLAAMEAWLRDVRAELAALGAPAEAWDRFA